MSAESEYVVFQCKHVGSAVLDEKDLLSSFAPSCRVHIYYVRMEIFQNTFRSAEYGCLDFARHDIVTKTAQSEWGNLKIGKGTLYFGTFADFNCPDGKMEILKYVLELMGEDVADVFCSNPNICFTERFMENGERVIDVLNVSSNSTEAEKFELVLKDGRKIIGEAKPCEITKVRI
jgi:hypothetical protein